MNRSAYVLLVDPSSGTEKFCNKAEEWLDEHEGEDLSIAVRPARPGEIAGVYLVDKFSLRGLGNDVPQKVSKLITKALEVAKLNTSHNSN